MKKIGNPDASAAAFQRIRKAHETEVAEDYVELIDDLITAHGSARLTDIAAYMGVAKSTASKMVQRLDAQGLVLSPPYGDISLTAEGKAMADASRARHKIVYDFLVYLGVDAQIAASDAEGMEHHISQATLAIFQRLMRKEESP